MLEDEYAEVRGMLKAVFDRLEYNGAVIQKMAREILEGELEKAE